VTPAGTGRGVGAGGPVPSFEAAVAAVLRATGPGDVLTYGEVAAEAGRPGAARAVGRVLSRSGEALPWWRVVTAGGRLVPGHEDEHQRLLRAEGVVVDGGRVRSAGRSARGGRCN
jgi:methylated-DNA-protein-cysteine methyltransferase related protein